MIAEHLMRRALDEWDPDTRPQHCSNCVGGHVDGKPDDPMAHCIHGHGRSSLYRLVRAYRPYGFRAMGCCADFDSMD